MIGPTPALANHGTDGRFLSVNHKNLAHRIKPVPLGCLEFHPEGPCEAIPPLMCDACFWMPVSMSTGRRIFVSTAPDEIDRPKRSPD